MVDTSIQRLYAADDPRRIAVPSRPGLVVALAAVGGALSAAAPVGWGPLDLVTRALTAGAAAWVGSRAPASTWLLPLVVGAALGGGSAFAIACVVTGLVVVAVLAGDDAGVDHEVAGAAALGVAAQSLLRLGDGGTTGVSAAVAVAAMVPATRSAWATVPLTARRRFTRSVLVVLGTWLVAASVFAVVAWRTRSVAEAAIEEARAGLAAARAGDLDAARTHLQAAADGFDDAASGFGSWLTMPARTTPLLGPNARALSTAASQGAALADAAATMVEAASVDELWIDGGIDVTRLTALDEPVTGALAAMRTARTELGAVVSPWLVPPLAVRLDALAADVDAALGDVTRFQRVLAAAPELLGAREPARHLVLFGTPSETREGGGIVATVAELVVDDGRLSLGRQMGNEALTELSTATGLTDPAAFPSRFVENEPWLFPQNWTGTPDFPTTAAAVREIYPQMAGSPVDGVAYVDPLGLAALLQLTGPVPVPELGRELSAETVVPFLVAEQYAEYPDEAQRQEVLGGAIDATVAALTARPLPGLADLVGALAPAVAGRHLAFVPTSDPPAAALEGSALVGDFPAPEGVDQIAVIQSNASASKLDAFLHREAHYQVTVDPTSGTVDSSLTVTLDSRLPPVVPPYMLGDPGPDQPIGTNLVQLSVYTPLELTGASVNDTPWALEQRGEYGQNRYLLTVAVLPYDPVTVRLDLHGARADLADGYRLRWVPQAMVNPDRVIVEVRGASGWRPAPAAGVVVDDGVASARFGAVTTTELVVPLER